MVDEVNFKHLLDIADVSQRNIALRRGFAAYTQLLDVTGFEVEALTILLNFTYPRKQIDDLLDKSHAKKILKNKTHMDKCISEVLWLHTHNLKYPDIRVSQERLLTEKPPLMYSYLLSSANCQKLIGWSHDSAKVNFAKFFSTHFVWQGNAFCLGTLLSEPIKEWQKAFQVLGMPVKAFINLCGRVKACLPDQYSPQVVDRFSTQVRMPYQDNYLSITPVVSHAFQAEIQQAAIMKLGRFTNIEFTRPAAVSEIAASLGGNIKVLNYPPRMGKASDSFSEHYLHKLAAGDSILNKKALLRSQFTQALDGVLFNHKELALKQRRWQRVVNIKQIRKSLSEWLTPLLELQLAIQDERVSLPDAIEDSFEYQFLTAKPGTILTLLPVVQDVLHSTLSYSKPLQKYAFHSQLIIPLKNCLKWILSNINQELEIPQIDSDKPLSRYLYLKNIRVFDAQALSNPYCVGVPSLTAVWGMMHNYQRRLNERLASQLRMTSFSWFLRQYSIVAGKKLPEYGMQGPSENQFKRAGIIDNRHCDFVFDLVIHIDGYEDELEKLDDAIDVIKASFPASLAGGSMHPPEIDVDAQWCELYSDEALLYSKLKCLPASGCWVMPTRHRLNDLNHLFQLLASNTSLLPVMLGYLLLASPEIRKNSLTPLHSYAESAIGVVECATPIEIRLQGVSNFFRRAFWMLDIKESAMLMKRV